ncbi:MAG TPA: YHS domain-containing (seleno)protein, partial [Chitinophagaceae bacterium]|nr:YHS domain-containing (seleno)protein [Chitinophagaceae bacterium]
KYVFKWKQANWYFSSKAHLDSFSNNPEKFAPQYGGFCAFACSNGRKAPTDPNAWAIIDGKLYLNKSLEIQEKWNQNQKERIEQADKNWPLVKEKE